MFGVQEIEADTEALVPDSMVPDLFADIVRVQSLPLRNEECHSWYGVLADASLDELEAVFLIICSLFDFYGADGEDDVFMGFVYDFCNGEVECTEAAEDSFDSGD